MYSIMGVKLVAKENRVEYQKNYYVQNKEVRDAYRKEYRKKNKEKISRDNREYREKNRAQISESRKKRYYLIKAKRKFMNLFNISHVDKNTVIQFEWSQSAMFRMEMSEQGNTVFLYDKIEEGGLGAVLYTKVYPHVPSMVEIFEDIEYQKNYYVQNKEHFHTLDNKI